MSLGSDIGEGRPRQQHQDLEQPRLSTTDGSALSESHSSDVEYGGSDIEMQQNKKRERVEKEDDDKHDEKDDKTDNEEDASGTVSYDTEEGEDDIDPSKLRPAPRPEKSLALVPVRFAWLTVSSLGIVYGDLGTSPLYTWPTILSDLGTYGEDDLIGAMCILIYSLLLIVTVKYATFILMADNKGEGGIFALTSLVPPSRRDMKKLREQNEEPPLYLRWIKRACVLMSIVGAGFILGDGAITPAISVLSAIEGLGVANTRVVDYEVILGLFILTLLFCAQPFGSSKIAFLFGPIMMVWFIFIAAVGIYNIVVFDSSVFRAFNPYYGYLYFQRNGSTGYTALGGICLCFTGVEALYADMGHFGKWPIRAGWLFIVLPSVTMSYFGQLAYILTHPNMTGPSFFECVPTPFFWPMMVVATLAAIIGSQSLISGTFSLISQGMGLDAFPPMSLHHTSERLHGQVFAPVGNWVLMVASLGLILFFQSSSALASAFGIAVTGTMAMTTLIFVAMVVLRWKWTAFLAVPFGAFFFLIEMVYFTANLSKFDSGGWVALLFAAITVVFMGSWKLGKVDVTRALAGKEGKTVRDVVRWANDTSIPRIPGTGVFLGGDDEVSVPKALLQHFKINRSLPSTVVMIICKTIDLPYIKPEAHLSCIALGPGLVKLTVRRGFVERRDDAAEMLQQAENAGVLKLDPLSPRYHYFIARQTVVLREARRFWSAIRLALYNFMVMNARPPAARSLVIPKQDRIEYHSELLIKKPLPGSNPISRWFNQ